MHAAAKEGHTDAAALLIKAGAKVNAKTKLDKFAPLMEAAKDGNAELVKLLLKSGAKRKIKDRLGRTAAKWGSDHTEIVAILGGKLSRKAAKAKKVSPEQKEKARKRLYELGYRTYDESMFVMSAHKGDLEAAKDAIGKVYQPPYTGYVEEQAKTKDGWRWQAWLKTDGGGKLGSIRLY